jgi:2-hydroxychromene-2-carboxylate isomerase
MSQKHVLSLGPNASVWEAACIMSRANCGSVLVMDLPGKLLGIVTERDLMTRVLAKALYRAYFTEGKDIGSPATVADIAGSVGLDASALAAALEDPALKDRAKREVESAIAAGVFGSPFFVVDGEAFWGVDRMPMVEEWIRTGGW